MAAIGQHRDDLVSAELEAVCIEIIKPYSKPFLVSTVYRPQMHHQSSLISTDR